MAALITWQQIGSQLSEKVFSTQVWSKKEGEGPPLGFPLLAKADPDQK
jgi:hypothetical protein